MKNHESTINKCRRCSLYFSLPAYSVSTLVMHSVQTPFFKRKMNSAFEAKPISQNLSSFLCLVLLLMLPFSVFPSASAQESLTAYEILQQYDFPVGLLPEGVTGYDIDRSTGRFTLFLKDTCSFTIHSYTLRYKSTITGVVTKGQISNLNGIQVKLLILWLNVGTVNRDGDDLDFSVGVLSASFSASTFHSSPRCGCGFHCVTEDLNRIKKVTDLFC